jgi:predicted metalloenzyme YecM
MILTNMYHFCNKINNISYSKKVNMNYSSSNHMCIHYNNMNNNKYIMKNCLECPLMMVVGTMVNKRVAGLLNNLRIISVCWLRGI